jgi:hypothetical protein
MELSSIKPLMLALHALVTVLAAIETVLVNRTVVLIAWIVLVPLTTVPNAVLIKSWFKETSP